MLPLKNTLLTKYPLLFSKKMKDTVSYFEWNLLSELTTQANVNAEVLINKADLVNGRIPYEQLPDLSFLKDEIYIGETPPYQEGVKVWIKPIEEQIQEDPMAMMFMPPELEIEEEPPQTEPPELEIEEEPPKDQLPELEIEEEKTEEEPPELVVQSE